MVTVAGATLVAAATGFTIARSGETNSSRVTPKRKTSAGILHVDVRYARAVDAVISNLNAQRREAGILLRSRQPRLRIEAMEALARAHAMAAARLAAINATGVSDVNGELITALRMTSASYKALAADARRNDTRGYRQAQSALVRAMTMLGSAFAGLRQLGYQVS